MAGNDKRLYKQLSHQDSGNGNTSNTSSSSSSNGSSNNTVQTTTTCSSGALQALSPPLTFVGSPVFSPGSSPAANAATPPSILVRTMSGSSTQGLLGVGGGGGGGGPGDSNMPRLCDTISSKTLFFLRSTLTSSFQPDYDFTDAKSEEFSRVPSIHWVMDAVRGNLSAAAGELFTSLEEPLWTAIEDEIHLAECDIYR